MFESQASDRSSDIGEGDDGDSPDKGKLFNTDW